MRRSRLRRRRLAAAALAPIAAIFTTTAFAEQAAPTGESARIDASSRSVPFGEPVPPSPAVDTGTGSERIDVRSRTTATVSDRPTLAGRTVKVRGRVSPAGTERRVVVDIRSDRQVIRAGRDGRFEVRWKVPDIGSYGIEVQGRG
jgi:hypothetical protein